MAINSLDQDYFGPEGYFSIKNSVIIYQDSHKLEAEAEISGDYDLAFKIIKQEHGFDILSLKRK